MCYLRRPEVQRLDAEFVAVLADSQTAGRGQRGTSWESAAGRNITAGLLLRPLFLRATEQFRLSEAFALAMADALGRYTDGIRVKWPNDIYYKDSKICGMLLEHDLAGERIVRTIIGPGINVNQAHFESDAPNPVSLCQIIGREVPLSEVWTAVLVRFERYYRCLQAGKGVVLDRLYHRRLYRRDGFHPYRDGCGVFRAEIVGVRPDGRLVLRDADGLTRTYAFKEVSIVLPHE